jgi:DNA-binding transcriptional LysR family regulator
MPLLHRRPTRPTEAGEVLLAHARLLDVQARAAEADLAALRGLMAGELRIGAFASA